MISAGEGRYRVGLESLSVGEDRLIVITGGEEEHIGSASLVEFGGRLQTIGKRGHHDHVVSDRVAKVIHSTIGREVLVVCGIHIEDASSDEINILVRNAEACVHLYLKREA